MIAEIKFLLAEKISNLKPENIMFYCGCKALQVKPDDKNADVLIDLCSIHEEVMKKLKRGEIKESEAKIPKIVITQEETE